MHEIYIDNTLKKYNATILTSFQRKYINNMIIRKQKLVEKNSDALLKSFDFLRTNYKRTIGKVNIQSALQKSNTTLKKATIQLEHKTASQCNTTV